VTTSRLVRESGNAGILLQMSGHFAATELGSGDVDEADRCHSIRAQLPSLRKSFLPGHCKLPELPRTRAWRQREARAFLAGSNKEPRTWRGLIQLFPLAYSGSARAWLGETVQLALTITISHRQGARCDGNHILARSEPSRRGQHGSPERGEIRRQANIRRRLMMEDDPGYGCLVISAQDARRVACDRCM
jgi:hypothetical protein